MPIGIHCILVGACHKLYWQGANMNVKCGRHGMSHSVMEAKSHDEGRVEEM